MKYAHIDGQASFCVENDDVKLTTTVLAGCTMPYFKVDGREICPYWTAPWSKDGYFSNGKSILSALRGNFICVAKKEDNNDPEHGWCCSLTWKRDETHCADANILLRIHLNDPDGGVITKTLASNPGVPSIYETNELCSFSGNYNISNHPCIRLASEAKNGYFSFSKPDTLCTPKVFLEKPENGGYMLLHRDEMIEDIHHVQSIYGDDLDLAYHPAKPGTIELLGAFHSQEIVYAAYVNTEERYIYYQLKSTKDYPYIMMWLFSGGRHYFPWNGTLSPTLGVEDSADYAPFFKNPGDYNTYVVLDPKQTYRFRQVYGVEKLPDGFRRIDDAVFENDGITFIGNDGLRAAAKVDWSFFKDR